MKQAQFKKIIAIATTINGHTEYISGQSVREFDNKYIPQFSTRVVHAKEFESEEDAIAYLANVINNFHRVFTVVTLEIPDIRDLKKYDRDYKKQQQLTGHHYHGGIKDGARMRGLLIALIAIVLVTLQSCASTKEGCWKGAEPKNRTTKMRA